MFYEEKIIDGILHCRGTPDGEWVEKSKVELTTRIFDLEARVAYLESLISEEY